MKKTFSMILLILALLAVFLTAVWYCDPARISDSFVIGNTEEAIIERYGSFYSSEQNEAGETVLGVYMLRDDTPEWIMSFDNSLWYEITFEGGIAQARMTAKFLSDLQPDAIYASDLTRAYDTARQTADLLGMHITKDPQLREIMAGLWETLPFAEIAERYADSYRVWLEDIGNSRCDGGESVKQLQQRIVTAVTRIAGQHPGGVVFLFTHATPIRSFATYCQGLPLDKMKEVPWPSNASVSQFAWDGQRFRLEEYSMDHFMGSLVTKLPSGV